MIIGHQKQWQFLIKSYQAGKISHAYLFSGQEKIGKKKLAIEFIKFLNCQSEKNKPCQKCRSCQDIEKGIFPDFSLIEPAVGEIKISQIREMEKYLSLYAYSSSFKIAIIDKAHAMTKEAQNSFLKTLEEPKGKTIFILITEYPEMLLATILSRVQKINFYPISQQEINNFLKLHKISDEKIKRIVELSSGRPGEIVDFIQEPQKIEQAENKLREIKKIAKSGLVYRFQYVKDLVERKEDLREILDLWLRYFRRLLLNEKNDQKSIIRLKNIIENISKVQLLISTTNINPRLALEILMLEL